MKLLVLIVAGIVIVIALIVGVAAFIGSRLPKAHSASRSIFLHQPPSNVYKVVRNFAAAPEWRVDVKNVVVESQPGGQIHFREEGKQGTVNYELAEDIPDQKLVTKILDTDLGYSGKWTYTLKPSGEGTLVTITEGGEVSNVIFRFMSRYVFGQTASLDAYLTALGKRFGETVTPR